MQATEIRQVDVVVIGAGPAGLAAAATAAAHGARVVLLDEQAQAGGQIYRDVDRVSPLRGALLGADYVYGKTLIAAVGTTGVEHIRNAAVWMIESGFQVTYSCGQRSERVRSSQLILATGSLERPMPLPGWTLPGVMTAGAAQILLKQSGIATRRAVLIGCGPLLYLVASQLARAGAPPLALLETQQPNDFKSSLRHWYGALRAWPYLLKGASMLMQLWRHRVPRYKAVRDIQIEGAQQAQSVRFTHAGQTHRIACETVLLHHGVVPNTQIGRSLGVSHDWSDQGQCFVPRCNKWGETDVTGVFIVGDGAGIGGARVAELSGQIAALRVVARLGRIDEPSALRQAAPIFKRRDAEMAIRPFLDAAYPPFTQALQPADNTTVCRCEDVTAGAIRGYAKLGCMGPNQAKAFGRCGMGPCQGRFCGLTVSRLLADAHGLTPDEVGYQRVRAPLKPVTLGELACMNSVHQPLNEEARYG